MCCAMQLPLVRNGLVQQLQLMVCNTTRTAVRPADVQDDTSVGQLMMSCCCCCFCCLVVCVGLLLTRDSRSAGNYQTFQSEAHAQLQSGVTNNHGCHNHRTCINTLQYGGIHRRRVCQYSSWTRCRSARSCQGKSSVLSDTQSCILPALWILRFSCPCDPNKTR